jgi:hypothetical protein
MTKEIRIILIFLMDYAFKLQANFDNLLFK